MFMFIILMTDSLTHSLTHSLLAYIYISKKGPGCGEVLSLSKLQRHQREDCENRKVPCKNWEYGCRCLVRIVDRARHEDASG